MRTWAADSFFFVDGGGMTSLSSSLVTRLMSSLASGLPATNAGPLRPPLSASSRRSRRSLPLRAPSSGPWHLKQKSDRIGRTSRWKSTAASAREQASDAEITAARTRLARFIAVSGGNEGGLAFFLLYQTGRRNGIGENVTATQTVRPTRRIPHRPQCDALVVTVAAIALSGAGDYDEREGRAMTLPLDVLYEDN